MCIGALCGGGSSVVADSVVGLLPDSGSVVSGSVVVLCRDFRLCGRLSKRRRRPDFVGDLVWADCWIDVAAGLSGVGCWIDVAWADLVWAAAGLRGVGFIFGLRGVAAGFQVWASGFWALISLIGCWAGTVYKKEFFWALLAGPV